MVRSHPKTLKREREQICFRWSPGILELMSKLAKAEGKSLNDFAESIFTDVLIRHGYRVDRSYSTKTAAAMFEVHPATLRDWLAKNPDIPVINRGKAGMRIPEVSVSMLRERMRS